MLIIRTEQMVRLAEETLRQYAVGMCESLRSACGARLADEDAATLLAHVQQAITTAHSYGMRSAVDCAAYLRLAVEWGWEFDTAPQNAWMLAFLTDPDVHAPGHRVQRLAAECRYRSRAAAHDRMLMAQFYGAQVAPA